MSREPIRIPFAPRNAHTVSITLEGPVIERCTAFAERIELANRKRKRRNVQGLTAKGKESLQLRVRGYLGEAALAIYLGLNPVRFADDWRERPDVLCFDCITTDKPHGSLIITPRDRLDMMKVLVIDESPVFHLCGWYRVADAREEAQRRHSEWWRTEREHGGAWYVPQAFLRSLSDEEAQQELMRYDIALIQDHYRKIDVRAESTITDEQFYTEIIDRAAAQTGVDPKALRASVDAVRDAPLNTIDWREVLRRAGAAPPEQEYKQRVLGVFPPQSPDDHPPEP